MDENQASKRWENKIPALRIDLPLKINYKVKERLFRLCKCFSNMGFFMLFLMIAALVRILHCRLCYSRVHIS